MNSYILHDIEQELGPAWRFITAATVWIESDACWLPLPIHACPDARSGLWMAAICGLLRFDAHTESQAIADAEVWLQKRFPNPKTKEVLYV